MVPVEEAVLEDLVDARDGAISVISLVCVVLAADEILPWHYQYTNRKHNGQLRRKTHGILSWALARPPGRLGRPCGT